MSTYYLRVEGVNLDNFVYDTNDLSTVRGGGLLMLDLVDKVKECLEAEGIAYQPISMGASWGLFSMQNTLAAASLLTRLRNAIVRARVSIEKQKEDGRPYTLEITPWRNATFVMDIVSAADDDRHFQKNRDAVHAQNRWRQMQELSLVLPGKNSSCENDPNHAVCGFDMVRPKYRWLQDEDKAISGHVFERREYGRDQKQNFYKKQVATIKNHEVDACIAPLAFVNDLNELTLDTDKEYGNLAGKMAVIYLDGNSFGKTMSRCETPDEQKEFNTLVREGQNRFLADLLQDIARDPRWLYRKKDQEVTKNLLRLETLLWGGDEIMWVVPAWQGWWLLAEFFRKTKTSNWRFQGRQLTFAAGLVFCHHKAPIHRIKKLAHDLADLAKDRGKEKGFVAYQVLESFDHAGTDLQAFRSRRCPADVKDEDLILDGNTMADLIPAMKDLKAIPDFSKRKLYQIVDALYNGRHEEVLQLEKKAGFTEKHLNSILNRLELCFGARPVCWLHLLELLDYIAPEEVSHATC